MLRRCFHGTSAMGKSGAELRWLRRQTKDAYVRAARASGFRCRSAFKLLEIQEKFEFLRPGSSVLDCGAAPGGWSQVAVHCVNSTGTANDRPRGSVIGIDLLNVAPLDGARFLCGCDATHAATHAALQKLLPHGKADVILSDMAPNATGIRHLDHYRLIAMCLGVAELAERLLLPGGWLLCKYWDGALSGQLHDRLSNLFQSVHSVKPKSSRKESAEKYFLAKAFREQPAGGAVWP